MILITIAAVNKTDFKRAFMLRHESSFLTGESVKTVILS
ncbi:hypothetical protein KP77_31880 [Jeotgalibacillus alimentarius]|uniref:Uncharacterized protein n=1 Tax=Jeotgalibacillus alimentarius TaxID=135826 RepID=A0A0C2V359_9BACL|nr:hypothetical protein KP77_31880 [Jeotgalibacillus alimentarius]